MHMADALMSPAVGAAGYAVSGTLLAAAAARTARLPHYRRVLPLMGLMGAFVFAAQMINFSIPGTGSSGHIGGGLLLAVLFGPWPALLIIASVLAVQCLFFADGGLLALGGNMFNLGFWPAFVGLPVFRAVAGAARSPGRVLVGAVLAAVLALELGAFSVVLETVLSGRADLPFGAFAGIMLGIHLPIAVAEGLMTAVVALWVWRTLPDRVSELGTPVGAGRRSGAAGLAALAGAVLFVGMVVAWFASPHPDGLEWSLEKITGPPALADRGGRLESRRQAIQSKTALLPDYGFAAADPEPAAPQAAGAWPAVSAGTSLAGLVGAALTAGVILLAGWILGRALSRRAAPPAAP